MLRCDNYEGLNVAAIALMTILDSKSIDKVAVQLKQSHGAATETLIRLISWSGNKFYFEAVLPYASSDNMAIKTAAINAFKSLASEKDQKTLISMILSSVDPYEEKAFRITSYNVCYTKLLRE